MKKLLVNFMSAKSGGGKNIFENFLKNMDLPNDVFIYLLCPPDFDLDVDIKNVCIVKVKPWMFRSYGIIYLYFIYIPRFCKKNKIFNVLNFGDLVLPRIKMQTYFFDWAYLIVDDPVFWGKMDFKSSLIRKLKINLIKLFSKNNSKVIVQSEAIGFSYREKMRFKGDVNVIPTPVSIDLSEMYRRNSSSNEILYVSNYAPHKNFEIIPKVAAILKARKVNCVIVLTLDEDSIEWKSLNNIIVELGVENYIKTLGRLTQREVFKALSSSKCLFFPSLLESYGIPLIEAMRLSVPILASDIPYIRSVCKDSVIYFDPYDEVEIANTIYDFFKGNVESDEDLYLKYSVILDSIPRWSEYTKRLILTSLD